MEQPVIRNIHTHLPVKSDGFSMVNIMINEVDVFLNTHPNQLISSGIHPWHIPVNYIKELELLEKISVKPQIKAIGEIGLDKLCNTDFNLQIEVFKKQLSIAERVHKPVIIHCVKAFNEIIQLKKELKPTVACVIHGFRGNEVLTEQLLNHGFYLSFGKNIPILSIRKISINRLFLETDDSDVSINEVYQQAASYKGISIEELIKGIDENYHRIF